MAPGYGQDKLCDEKAQELIDYEIHGCQSVLVEAVISHERGPLEWDEVENFYLPQCPGCGSFVTVPPEEERDEDGAWKCEICKEYLDEDLAEAQPQEILEWWHVTSYLADQLRELREPTLTDGQSHWWGRTCSGQAILLDGTMQEIVFKTGYRGYEKPSVPVG